MTAGGRCCSPTFPPADGWAQAGLLDAPRTGARCCPSPRACTRPFGWRPARRAVVAAGGCGAGPPPPDHGLDGRVWGVGTYWAPGRQAPVTRGSLDDAGAATAVRWEAAATPPWAAVPAGTRLRPGAHGRALADVAAEVAVAVHGGGGGALLVDGTAEAGWLRHYHATLVDALVAAGVAAVAASAAALLPLPDLTAAYEAARRTAARQTACPGFVAAARFSVRAPRGGAGAPPPVLLRPPPPCRPPPARPRRFGGATPASARPLSAAWAFPTTPPAAPRGACPSAPTCSSSSSPAVTAASAP
ncbi:hypothetical protein BU14_0234s0012 [Porphyra umbilicalis]|uniref:Uncharacterized protein n=1 Tax=Porphyra umbilicalis TaxID=2786 RepID=A0A1X6P408_PORUM|nr:hypothetical protein BU14_0234s0012 [Porphyra umbilicalis]|eukprot:OSX75485.1 hypothetical protein BU14_0234s0012 [Porphyra umbilicalis]